MKKTVFAFSFILTLFLAVAGTVKIDYAAANPMYRDLDFPDKPIMAPPTIVLDSPIQNRTYESNEIWLNFTIIKPAAWFKGPSSSFGTDDYGNHNYLFFVRITSIYFILNNDSEQNILVEDNNYVGNRNTGGPFPNRTLEFSSKLNLTEGANNVVIGFEADSYYKIQNVEKTAVSLSGKAWNWSSKIINFSVELPTPPAVVPAEVNSKEQQPFNILGVLGLFVLPIAIVVICLVYYRKKSRSQLFS